MLGNIPSTNEIESGETCSTNKPNDYLLGSYRIATAPEPN